MVYFVKEYLKFKIVSMYFLNFNLLKIPDIYSNSSCSSKRAKFCILAYHNDSLGNVGCYFIFPE